MHIGLLKLRLFLQIIDVDDDNDKSPYIRAKPGYEKTVLHSILYCKNKMYVIISMILFSERYRNLKVSGMDWNRLSRFCWSFLLSSCLYLSILPSKYNQFKNNKNYYYYYYNYSTILILQNSSKLWPLLQFIHFVAIFTRQLLYRTVYKSTNTSS